MDEEDVPLAELHCLLSSILLMKRDISLPLVSALPSLSKVEQVKSEVLLGHHNSRRPTGTDNQIVNDL